MRTHNVAVVVATVAALSIPTAQALLDRPVAPPALSQSPSGDFINDCIASVT
jgi:hypothetical protein